MNELKPCPFCGGEASRRYHPHNAHTIECNNCHASTCVTAGTQRSVDEWNNRPHENKIKADAVREAANSICYFRGLYNTATHEELNEFADKIERGEL